MWILPPKKKKLSRMGHSLKAIIVAVIPATCQLCHLSWQWSQMLMLRGLWSEPQITGGSRLMLVSYSGAWLTGLFLRSWHLLGVLRTQSLSLQSAKLRRHIGATAELKMSWAFSSVLTPIPGRAGYGRLSPQHCVETHMHSSVRAWAGERWPLTLLSLS